MKKDKIIVLDTETTGLDPYGISREKDEILQLSIINEEGIVLFNNYFRPEHKTEWKETEEIHGISPNFVTDKLPLSYYIDEIQTIIDNADAIIGYNLELDKQFLGEKGIFLDNKIIIDVAEAYAEFYGDWNDRFRSYKMKKLEEVAKAYNFDFDSFDMRCHDSLADCFLTLYCYQNVRSDVIAMWHDKFNEKIERIISNFDSEVNGEIIETLIKEALHVDCESFHDFETNVGYQDWMEAFSIDDEELDCDAISNLLERIYSECEELRAISMKEEIWE